MTGVVPLDAGRVPAWDAFVAAHPHGTFFHRAAWADVIRRAFRHTPHYLVAERDGAVVGVLPLVQVKTLLFGNSLVSNPFCVYGGPLGADEDAVAALDRAATALMAAAARAHHGMAAARPHPARPGMAGTGRPVRHLPQADRAG